MGYQSKELALAAARGRHRRRIRMRTVFFLDCLSIPIGRGRALWDTDLHVTMRL
jgi:hypothetical protein